MDVKNLVGYWKRTGIIKDERLLKAFAEVPRELFVEERFRGEAYHDYPLPIGKSQTISQPSTAMVMTQALGLEEGNKVLEVGSGSGWQAALIARIVGKKGRVITTEIIPELAELAKNNIRKAGLRNVKVLNVDGSKGYKKEAPYDRCIVTAACPRVPHPLVEQLRMGGIMVIPVGSLVFGQDMLKITKTRSGLSRRSLGTFLFVPLKGKYGY